VASVVTYVKAGYFDESDDVVGISHVLEHMFFKGTPTRGVGEIARETKARGGYLNAHTIYDHTAYQAVLPREGFARGLEIQADAYAHSLLDESELRKELEVIIQEAKRKADSPTAVAVETLYALLHDRHRIRRWRIGREPGLRALTRSQLADFYRGFYTPGNTILVIVGDVDVDDTLRHVESLYGELADRPVVRTASDPETEDAQFRYRELTGDIAQTHVVFGWRTPPVLHPDTVPLDLFAMVMGSGRASRLYRFVRERQLASSVFADNNTLPDVGVFVIHAEGPPPLASDAARAMWHQVELACDGGIAAGDIERVQRMFESQWVRRLETMEGQAGFLAEWEALGDWHMADAYFTRMMAETPAAVMDTAGRYLDAGQTSLLIYRPERADTFAVDAMGARAKLHERTPHAGASRPRRAQVALERRVGPMHVFRTRGEVPIVVLRRSGSPMAHLAAYTGVGAAQEPADIAGVATLMARGALKGSERRTAQQIASESELLGGSIGASVSSDRAGWSFSVPARHLAHAVDLLADVVTHPRLDQETLDTERAIALANLAELRDDMYRYPVRLATLAAYATHPYGRGILGTEESLRAVQTGHVREWHRWNVLQSPALVAAVADVDEADVAALLADAFDSLVSAPPTFAQTPAWPERVVVMVEPRDRAQTAMAVLFPSPARRDDRRFAAHLIAGVASGLGGRFFDALREKQSLAYTVSAYPAERVSAGMFVAYIATSPEQEERARDGLLTQFARLRDELVGDDELERAKIYALGSHAIARQSGATVLGELVDAWLSGTGLEEIGAFESRVQAVTAEEMRDLARAHFDPQRRVEGIVRGRGA
jgi:zinc protease